MTSLLELNYRNLPALTTPGSPAALFPAIKVVVQRVLTSNMAAINIYFNSTGQMYQIKSHITCNTSNVIYLIQCVECNLQYIGETKRRLKDRFNEHRRPIINTSSYTPTAVSEHFLTSSHTVDDMTLIPIEHVYTKRDSIRKAREAFLIHFGNTLKPAGLNRRDEMQFCKFTLFVLSAYTISISSLVALLFSCIFYTSRSPFM